jgi:phospholipase C
MASRQPEIEHVVVLMMENQSFDRLLGFVPGVGRLQGNEWASNRTGEKVFANRGAHPIHHHSFDPPHSFQAVTSQLYDDPQTSRTNPEHLPTGSAFLSAIDFQCAAQTNGTTVEEEEQKFMCCFDNDGTATAALATLAQNFVVCDRWFCSVPGPTAPNRLFVHCATSGGYTGGKWRAEQGLNLPRSMESVFESLDNAGHSWALYYEGGVKCDCNTAMAIPYVSERKASHVHDLQAFHAACRSDSLPHYSFLSVSLMTTSQHPGKRAAAVNSMVRGDNMIAEVYESIRGNEAVWKKTLLVITYDEAGGYWDSIAPKHSVPHPGPLECGGTVCDKTGPGPAFHFRHVGPRVPTILVSAWLDPRVDSYTYDHASVSAMLKGIFHTNSKSGPKGFLSQRDLEANNPVFLQWYRTSPRTDLVVLPRSRPLAFLKWGQIHGPKIRVSEDRTTATDVADNPTSGDDSWGRYRLIRSDTGFDTGTHVWNIKLASVGRCLIGICTGEVFPEWRERNGKRALSSIKQAWTVCVPSDDSPNMKMWHAGTSTQSGLPSLHVGGLLGVKLDCDAHTLTFTVDGKGDAKATFHGLPADQCFYPVASFGGDHVKGCCLELLDESAQPSVGFTEIKKRRMM